MARRKRFFNGQRVSFFLVAALFAVVPTALFADLLRRAGYTEGFWPLAILFALLCANVAWGATHSLIGFLSLLRARRGGDASSRSEQPGAGEDLAEPGSVAIVLPVYNEDPVRVFAGLRAMYLSLQRTGQADRFDFFVLSDSNRSERWIQEEHAWAKLCRDLNAFGRINYRRRKVNTDKKAGNLLEFCESWGGRYRYMVTLDADSVLSGDTILEMYRRMERNPRIGILQTGPKIVFAESFWGRVQQFANHFYGPIFAAGLNFWQQGEGNYWGHNAMIRMGPFMEYCALPDLPGREPFGGKILSHDFVEAALMQRAGYEVVLADDLGGSFEECPQDIVEHAKRDRRWCQGNMQHVWLLFSRGLKSASRIHLANGIMGYASSLLWAMFLVLGGIFLFNRVRSRLTELPIPGWGDLYAMPLAQHAVMVTLITLSLLFLPKVLAVLHAFVSGERAAAFGGRFRCVASVIVETLVSVVTAPVMMIYHAKFVVFTAFGKGVGWSAQKRDAGEGLSLSDAVRAHGVQSLIGVLATVLAGRVSPSFLYWLLPVSGSLALAPLTSWLVSKPSIGWWLKRSRILATQEEIEPSRELEETRECERLIARSDWLFESDEETVGFMNVVVDPYLNAIRATLAESMADESEIGAAVNLGRVALGKGPQVLSEVQRRQLLSDPEALLETHRLAWMWDPKNLHPSWAPYFARYTPVAGGRRVAVGESR